MNRLAQETSPYLLQHADNPVDWYPWGEEALARAREEDKPILLSVGYAACHWCHVMEHESFEDERTAALMNEYFVPVKVDREERPDVDSVYMDAVVSLTGHGGWPMTVFLTPTGEPFFGGTYYPPEPRHGLPSFKQLLQAIASAWRERRADIDRDAGAITEQLRRTAEPSHEPLTSSLLSDAVRGLRQQFDPVWGGFGTAPKFPPASALEFLLRRGELEPATKTLDGMALGGMYDLVGGGFHRYSVDREWLVPHFEKMLYDNALLVPAYLHGWLVTGNERYREVAEPTTFRGSSCSRSSTVASSFVESSIPRPVHGSSTSVSCGRSRSATTRRSHRGTGLRWPRLRSRADASIEPTISKLLVLSRSSSSARSRPRKGGFSAAGARARRSTQVCSRITQTWPTASTSCTLRQESWGGSRSRAGLRSLRSRCSATRSAAASS